MPVGVRSRKLLHWVERGTCAGISQPAFTRGDTQAKNANSAYESARSRCGSCFIVKEIEVKGLEELCEDGDYHKNFQKEGGEDWDVTKQAD